MTKRNKLLNILSLIVFIYLIVFSFKANIFSTNLSRVANSSSTNYFSFLLLCFLFGLFMFNSLRIQHLNRIAYVGLFSLLIGGITPYNYIDTNSFFSNVHLIGGYLSIGFILICELYSLFYYERINKKVNYVFKICLIAIAGIAIYQYGTYLYINTFVELIYVGFVLISQTIILNSIINKMKVLVIGAALSGTEVSKLLIKKGYEVFLTDSKKIENKKELEDLGIKVFDEGHPDSLKEINYDFVVKNPGIKYNTPFVSYFVNKGVKILNEIEVANSFVDYKIAAITGTNGKTTTTTLLGEILKKKYNDKACVCGNIGYPFSSIVNEHENDSMYVALEISGFQLLGCPNFKPKVSTILNLSPDHLDYYDSLNDYYDSKCLVYKNQNEDDYFIRNIDDPSIVERFNNSKCKVIDISLKQECDICIKNDSIYYKDVELFSKNDLKIVGEHNLFNAMVAATMAYLLGADTSTIKEVIRNFKGVEHRIEFVKEIDDVKYYNDSKGTNVDASVVALKAFEKPVILLAGGHDKHTGFKEVIPYLNKVKYMFAFGETKVELKKIYPEAIVVNDMQEAILAANKIARPGDIVLLSPMCSSYDQFKNFEERGRIFKEIVNNL